MRAREIINEGAPLDAALRRGWVAIRYQRLDGRVKSFVATTHPSLFTYTRRGGRVLRSRRIITVWDRQLGWRSLRRNRVLHWASLPPGD